MNLPENVKYILSALDGYRTYIYGRVMRDIFMDVPPRICRVITSAPVPALRRIFPNSPINKGKLRITLDNTDFTIISATAEPDYLCSVQDFTLDSAAYSPIIGIIDNHGAKADIENRIIRFTDDYEDSLRANPLIMAKAVRLCAELNFTLAPKTAEMIKNCAAFIKRVNCRVLTSELEKLLMSDNPDYFRMLHELGLLKYIIPQSDRCFGEPQRNKYHIYDVGEHIMNAVKNTPRNYVLRWAALLHDVGKPCCSSTDNKGTIHFYGHHRESRTIADDVLHRLGLSNDLIRDILILIENHDVRVDPNPVSVKKMMCRTGGELFEMLMHLQTADNMAKNPKFFTDKYRKINAALKISKQVIENKEPYQYSDLLINRADLQKIGIRPGRESSEIMRMLMDDVINDPSKNSRDILLNRAKELKR